MVELLESEPRLAPIVAGRSRRRAGDYCKGRSQARAELIPAMVDRNGDLGTQLATLRPEGERAQLSEPLRSLPFASSGTLCNGQVSYQTHP
jgi:hypothetical protein